MKIALALGLALVAMPALAQLPYDGSYAGVSRDTSSRPRDTCDRAGNVHLFCCPFARGASVPLTIANGVVSSAARHSAVDANGNVKMQNNRTDWVTGQIDAAGVLHGKQVGNALLLELLRNPPL